MPSSFFPFSFGPPDEEMRRKMQEEHEEQLRSALDFQHTLEEAWDKLGFEELYAVAQWLTMLCDSPVDVIRSRLAYQSGSLFRLTSQRGNKCMVCDKNHDEQVALLLADPEAIDSEVCPQSDEAKPHAWTTRHDEGQENILFCIRCDKVRNPSEPADIEPAEQSSTEADTEAEASFQESQRIIAEHEAKVKEYRLQQDFKKGGFSCTGCGMHYATLEDRMLKEPGIEGCPGCIHKAKFG